MIGGLFTYCQFGVARVGELVVDVCCGGATHILFDWRSARPNEAHYGYSNWTGIRFSRAPMNGWDPAMVRAFGIYPQFRVLGHQINIIMPWWIPLALCLAITAAARRSANRWKRLRTGECLTCGYDLTGNTARRCPECGETAKVAT